MGNDGYARQETLEHLRPSSLVGSAALAVQPAQQLPFPSSSSDVMHAHATLLRTVNLSLALAH